MHVRQKGDRCIQEEVIRRKQFIGEKGVLFASDSRQRHVRIGRLGTAHTGISTGDRESLLLFGRRPKRHGRCSQACVGEAPSHTFASTPPPGGKVLLRREKTSSQELGLPGKGCKFDGLASQRLM